MLRGIPRFLPVTCRNTRLGSPSFQRFLHSGFPKRNAAPPGGSVGNSPKKAKGVVILGYEPEVPGLQFRFAPLLKSVAFFVVGYLLFLPTWTHRDDTGTAEENSELREKLESHPLVKELESHHKNGLFRKVRESQTIPDIFKPDHVSMGLLFGPGRLTVDPMQYFHQSDGTAYAFFHLGPELCNHDGTIHNGILATLLDEGLCMAGFPFLPSKRGMTGSFRVEYQNRVPPDSFVVLKAKVVEHKGRKVVIEGGVETLEFDDKPPTVLATARCVLIEPKFFKYIHWALPF